MKKIGFKNFRRFVDFPLLEYGPITFLVGRNNSGKSTLVQALLLINNYFQRDRIKLVDLENNILDESNMLTFERAKNKTNDKDDSISFIFQLEEFEVFFQIIGIEKRTWAYVSQLNIKDLREGYAFYLNSGGTIVEKQDILNKEKEFSPYGVEDDIEIIEKEMTKIKETLLKSNYKKTDKNYLELTAKLYSLQKSLTKRKKTLKALEININKKTTKNISYSFDISLDFHSANISDITKEVIEEIERWYDLSLNEKEWIDYGIEKNEAKSFFVGYKEGFGDKKNIEKCLNKFITLIKNNEYKYIGANSIKPKSLFYIKDKSNPLTQAINEYKKSEIDDDPGCPAWSFTRKWMKEFEIGEDFKIIMHAGEAFEFKIISNNIEIPLTDKGMGSVQLMMLILRIACLIQKSEYGNGTKTIIVEEPESNLHPALQSKLADMFLYVNQLYNKKLINRKIEFIIETHSEYIIRRSQVLVKENEYEIYPNENPFCIYYFPKDNIPYNMEYEENGRFKRNFEEGFFEVATKSTMSLLKPKTIE
jgi:predicted ATP-dependent endonuclease of OLD family